MCLCVLSVCNERGYVCVCVFKVKENTVGQKTARRRYSREREEEGDSKHSERKWTLGATPASVGRIRRGAQKEVGAIVLYCRLRLLRPSVDVTGGGNHTHGGAMPQ